MDLNAQKEQFSIAFVGAVAAAAGYKYGPALLPDDESVDACMRSGDRRFPQIDLQLKCTAGLTPDADPWTFSLKLKNYEDLRVEDCCIPRILVVVSVPAQPEDWLEANNTSLHAQHSARWLSLKGMPSTANAESVSVHIPAAQRLDVAAVRDLFCMVERGEL